jgi:hypothetical protein
MTYDLLLLLLLLLSSSFRDVCLQVAGNAEQQGGSRAHPRSATIVAHYRGQRRGTGSRVGAQGRRQGRPATWCRRSVNTGHYFWMIVFWLHFLRYRYCYCVCWYCFVRDEQMELQRKADIGHVHPLAGVSGLAEVLYSLQTNVMICFVTL